MPQVLINVPVTDRLAVAASDEVAGAVNAVEDELGDTGRVLLRPSGTEPVVRVMVEGEDLSEVTMYTDRLVDDVEAAGRRRGPAAVASAD